MLATPGMSRWKGTGVNVPCSQSTHSQAGVHSPHTRAHTSAHTRPGFPSVQETKHLQSSYQTTRGIPSLECISGAFHPERLFLKEDWEWALKSRAACPQKVRSVSPSLTSFMVVLFCSQRHSITLILQPGGQGSAQGWGAVLSLSTCQRNPASLGQLSQGWSGPRPLRGHP